MNFGFISESLSGLKWTVERSIECGGEATEFSSLDLSVRWWYPVSDFLAGCAFGYYSLGPWSLWIIFGNECCYLNLLVIEWEVVSMYQLNIEACILSSCRVECIGMWV